MATSTKTLNPTNQTITIPDMTERPNVSLLTDGIGKEADAINALNSNNSTEVFNTFASQSALETALETLGSSMSAQQFKNIRFNLSPAPASGAFAKNNGFYIGTIKKSATDRYTVEAQCDRESTSAISGDLVVGAYYNSSWVWHNISNEIETLNIQNPQIESPENNQTITIDKRYTMIAIYRFYNNSNKSAIYGRDFSNAIGAITSNFTSSELTVTYSTSTGWSITNKIGGNISVVGFIGNNPS